MKNVLFATTALVAFAGAAAAQSVSFSGSVEVGYKDSVPGLYAEGGLTLTAAKEFDNGVSLEVSIGADLYAGGPDLGWDAFPTVKVMTERVTLTVGDVEYAAVDMFNMVDGMTFGTVPLANRMREVDGEMVARLDATFGDFAVGVSVDALGTIHPTNALSIGATGSFGSISFSAMYDQALLFDDNGDNANNNPTPEISVAGTVFGVSVGAEFGSFTVDLAYMSEDFASFESSTGIGIGANLGGWDLAAYYAMNNSADPDAYGVSVDGELGAATVGAYWDGDSAGGSNFGATVDYAVSDAITASAGFDQADSWFVAVVMDIADGAEVGAAYSDAGNSYDAGINLWFSADF